MVTYTIAEMLNALKERQFENFRFFEKQAVVNIVDEQTHIEVIFQSSGEVISTDFLDTAVKVLEQLDDCVKKAYGWLDMCADPENPDAFENGFEINGLFFGDITCGTGTHQNGFSISFEAADYYPLNFSVKFLGHNMQPVAVEQWVL